MLGNICDEDNLIRIIHYKNSLIMDDKSRGSDDRRFVLFLSGAPEQGTG